MKVCIDLLFTLVQGVILMHIVRGIWLFMPTFTGHRSGYDPVLVRVTYVSTHRAFWLCFNTTQFKKCRSKIWQLPFIAGNTLEEHEGIGPRRLPEVFSSLHRGWMLESSSLFFIFRLHHGNFFQLLSNFAKCGKFRARTSDIISPMTS